MRTIRTTTGAAVPLDGDLLAIMEILYREVTAKRRDTMQSVPGRWIGRQRRAAPLS